MNNYRLINKSTRDMSHLNPFIKDFMPYAQKHMKFNKMPTIMYYSDQDNAAKTFGKTAYYDPSAHNIVLYVDGRHPKDIMSSLSHELVHHKQNCAGQFDNMSAVAGEQGYAQKDSHLREMEREAYELGNMVFRDWEDTRRDYLQENNYFKRSNNMSTKQWKDKELNRLLMEKWGYFKEGAKPDYIDLDKDGDKEEPMKKAAQDAKQKGDSDEDELEEGKGMSPGRATGHPFFKSKEEGGYDPVARDKKRGGPPKEDEPEKELDEGGAASRYGNEDRDVGRDRMVADRMDEEQEEGVFAPNHYCVHHGGVNHNGKVQMAEAVSHNYNFKLNRVTHYDMKLANGTILENVAVEDIHVTNASLAEGHGGHMSRQDREDDEEEKMAKEGRFPSASSMKEKIQKNKHIKEGDNESPSDAEKAEISGKGKASSGKMKSAQSKLNKLPGGGKVKLASIGEAQIKTIAEEIVRRLNKS